MDDDDTDEAGARYRTARLLRRVLTEAGGHGQSERLEDQDSSWVYTIIQVISLGIPSAIWFSF